jgi:hypothetical protein
MQHGSAPAASVVWATEAILDAAADENRARDHRSDASGAGGSALDDTAWLVPVAHMFVRSAQPGVLPAANAECH